MTALGWTLIGVSYLVLAFFTAVCLGRLFRINVEAPKQRARRVMRQRVQWEVDDAVEEARQSARLETSARSEGAGW